MALTEDVNVSTVQTDNVFLTKDSQASDAQSETSGQSMHSTSAHEPKVPDMMKDEDSDTAAASVSAMHIGSDKEDGNLPSATAEAPERSREITVFQVTDEEAIQVFRRDDLQPAPNLVFSHAASCTHAPRTGRVAPPEAVAEQSATDLDGDTSRVEPKDVLYRDRQPKPDPIGTYLPNLETDTMNVKGLARKKLPNCLQKLIEQHAGTVKAASDKTYAAVTGSDGVLNLTAVQIAALDMYYESKQAQLDAHKRSGTLRAPFIHHPDIQIVSYHVTLHGQASPIAHIVYNRSFKSVF